jgi:hypothetical protein
LGASRLPWCGAETHSAPFLSAYDDEIARRFGALLFNRRSSNLKGIPLLFEAETGLGTEIAVFKSSRAKFKKTFGIFKSSVSSPAGCLGHAMDTASIKDQQSLLEKWKDFSKIFYDAFPIDRYQGLQWFFIEILVHFDKKASIEELKETVSNHKLTDNPNYYVSALLENLNSLGFIEFLGPQNEIKNSPISESGTEDYVRFTKKFSDAISKYVFDFCKSIDVDAPNLAEKTARGAMIAIYDFMMHNYLPFWRQLLCDIARIVTSPSGAPAKSLEGKLRDDSVIYVFIHSFWDNFLFASNESVSSSRALHFADKVRIYEPETTVPDRLELLSTSKILLQNGVGKRATYTLNPILEPRLSQYTADLIDYTDRLIAEVRRALE